jgi:hypothetical protein
MTDIHPQCLAAAPGRGRYVDYGRGAIIAGFRKVEDAMVAYGLARRDRSARLDLASRDDRVH